MYGYDWDKKTGGLILNTRELKMSKEPRPVYSDEMDILGFDKYFNYEKQSDTPYMWSETNKYFYRGELVAHTKGGGYDEKPELILDIELVNEKMKLEKVNVEEMIENNKDVIEAISQFSIKEVYNTYLQYKDKVDIFYVAFSGGKDSVVLLDIVQRAIPHNELVVVFGDTSMEFADTYEVVEETKEFCKREGIHFIHSVSHKDPMESWREFGPPATTKRWCCSVHKTAPQIIAIRQYLNKNDFRGMAFVGVRGDESLRRSNYDYLSDGKKHKGQLSCNAILKWNSAEIYLYMYFKKLSINKAYIKGNARAGCLVCPGASHKNDYMNHFCYKEDAQKYVDAIESVYKDTFTNKARLDEFVKNGGWKARKNGRDLNLNTSYKETRDSADNMVITIENLNISWKEWIKTIGNLINDSSPYKINYKGVFYTFTLEEVENKSIITIDYNTFKQSPSFAKYLKNVFKKASSCTGCRVCEADCPFGNLSFNNNVVSVSDKCISCLQCHKVENGCLVYNSLRQQIGGIIMKDKGSLNRYSHFAPLYNWFEQYFEFKEDFDDNHSLGTMMYSNFKRFLRDTNLLNQKGFTRTAEIVETLSLDSDVAWAIMLVDLANTSQVNWYIKNTTLDEEHSREYFKIKLEEAGAKPTWTGDIISSLTRIVELPFGEIGLGRVEKDNDKVISFTREKWEDVDAKVVLYGLYKYAEESGMKPELSEVKKELKDKKILENDREYVEKIDKFTQFSLDTLMDYEIESEGISPTEIFGIEKEEMIAILKGLSVNYPEFISVSFTHDLDNINLKSDKTSFDVLELFV